MDDVSVSVSGMEELQESLLELVKKYPDKAGQYLRKNAADHRKDVARKMRENLNTHDSHKKSLGKTSSYKVSRVQGLGTSQFVETSANSPHFHLIENGHVLKSHSGKNIGFVPGFLIMDEVTRQYEEKAPELAGDMIDKLLKEEGFK